MSTKQIITAVAILFTGVLIGKFTFTSSTKINTDTHKNETIEEHWTCSMHPQIDMPEFGQCPICGMDLIPKGDDQEEGLSKDTFKMSKNAMALANIETLTVGSASLDAPNTLELSGKIATNKKASSVQTAHFGGRLERLKYKTVGEYVSKGSFIAAVYSPALVTAQNEFIEAIQIKNLQPALYNAVRNKLKNWKISEKQIQKIENTKKVITNFNMYANVSGYIDEILVQEGNHVKEGAPLFRVSNRSSVWAVFDVYENDIKQLKQGQEIAIKLKAYPNELITTKIDFIDPNLKTSTRTIDVRATLKNINNRLKPGMFVSSKVAMNDNHINTTTISIPKTAVLWTGKRSIVYVKKDKNKPIFELREVDLGASSGDKYTIISGLKSGDEVVVNGAFTVDAAAQLLGKKSMMNQKKKMIPVEPDNSIGNGGVLKVSSKFMKPFDLFVDNYVLLKDAFVASNTLSVQKKSLQTLKSLAAISMKYLKNPEAHEIWMKALPKFKKALQLISKSNEIETQRSHFINLSNALKNVLDAFGATKTVYVQHCPMANKNDGADWLSFTSEIKNPYFGEKMLKCGSTIQTLKSIK